MSEKVYLFHGYKPNPRTIIVKAETEEEARGIMQKNTISGMDPEFRGEIDNLVDEEGLVDLRDFD